MWGGLELRRARRLFALPPGGGGSGLFSFAQSCTSEEQWAIVTLPLPLGTRSPCGVALLLPSPLLQWDPVWEMVLVLLGQREGTPTLTV